MSSILLETTDAASHFPSRAIGFASAGLDSPSKFLRESRVAEILPGHWRFPPNPGTARSAESLTFSEVEFWLEKQAFLSLPPTALAQYMGEFVVVHNGQILDHDPDLRVLTNRFFHQVDDMPVYITKVGDQLELRIDTPFFE